MQVLHPWCRCWRPGRGQNSLICPRPQNFAKSIYFWRIVSICLGVDHDSQRSELNFGMDVVRFQRPQLSEPKPKLSLFYYGPFGCILSVSRVCLAQCIIARCVFNISDHTSRIRSPFTAHLARLELRRGGRVEWSGRATGITLLYGICTWKR